MKSNDWHFNPICWFKLFDCRFISRTKTQTQTKHKQKQKHNTTQTKTKTKTKTQAKTQTQTQAKKKPSKNKNNIDPSSRKTEKGFATEVKVELTHDFALHFLICLFVCLFIFICLFICFYLTHNFTFASMKNCKSEWQIGILEKFVFSRAIVFCFIWRGI